MLNDDTLFCAVFCVDYSIELDLVISGSSDCTVKLWQMSSGLCLATKLGHEHWLTSVSQECCCLKVPFHPNHILVCTSVKIM